MIRICLAGARGRMGRMLQDLIGAEVDLALTSAIERSDHPEVGKTLTGEAILTADSRGAITGGDVLVDFGPPEALLEHAAIAADLGRPVVSGTTGLSKEQAQALAGLAARIPVVWSANMSRGVHALKTLVGQAAKSLAGYDAEILEIHHRGKADAPSGTALALAAEIQRARAVGAPVYGRQGRRGEGEIGISAVRGGDVVGEHQVMFLAAGEQILLVHRATSREHFCRGALAAVRFVVGRAPGLYGMDQVFGEV